MHDTIQQKDINNAAWAACDTFRGVVDPAQYKDYILVTLFLKYISDVWDDHYEQYRNEYNNDDEAIRRRLSRERFVIPNVTLKKHDEKTGEEIIVDTFPATYTSLFERRTKDTIGELINVVLSHIEEENKAKLAGVFRNIDFNSEINLGKTRDRNRRLKQLLEDFHKPELNMRPSRVSEDVIGNTYMYLIERFASDAGKKAGEFFTPLKISTLVARLAQPKNNNRICDPACGSGGLLVEAARLIPNDKFALFGQESNGSTQALCRMNMFLHHYDSTQIEWCDTLNNPQLIKDDALMKFDCVVANPPFSLKKWGAEKAEHDAYNRFWRGIPPKSKGDWAFITHMVEIALAKTGRVVVIVPHGVLSRGASEGRIRQKMIEENLLDAVIGLPSNLFQTTNISVAILIFDKAREKGGARANCKDVLFIDASKEFVAGKNQNTLADTHIEKIMHTYISRKVVEKYSYCADVSEIAENDFQLKIRCYFDTFEEEDPIDIDAVQQEIAVLEKELAEVQTHMAQKLRDIRR